MRECIKCKLVKRDYKFWKRWWGAAGYFFNETTWLCKSCAKNIAEEAIEKEYKNLEKKL